jgi:hypothetical protein
MTSRWPSPKARREARMKADRIRLANEENPTLPKPCQCEKKDCIPAHDEDGTPYCFKCTGGLAA